jgi:hypothetical protein
LLTGLEASKAKFNAMTDLVSGEVSIFFANSHLLIVSHMAERREIICYVSSYKDPTPIHEDSVLGTSSLPKGPVSECHHTGDLGFYR